MLPKPKFESNPRKAIANVVPPPQPNQSWLQYNPNQSLNQQIVYNYPNYNQSYYNFSNKSLGNNFQPNIWHQNNYNSANNFNVWTGYQNQTNIGFNPNQYQSFSQSHQQYNGQNNRFRDNNQKSFNNNSNVNNKSFNCDPCNRWFKTEEQLNQHLNEHILCGLDECKFRAHPKVIESHQRMQHFCFRDKTLIKKFMSLDTEEDIEKWKEERRRNFPTKDNLQKKEDLKEKQRLEAIELKNKANDAKEEDKQNSGKSFDRQKDRKSKKFMKSKQKEGPKPIPTFKNNRKLTLFQKLMMTEKQEENNEKVLQKSEINIDLTENID